MTGLAIHTLDTNNEKQLLVGGQHGQVRAIESRSMQVTRKLLDHLGPITFVVDCAELSYKITGCKDNSARVWKIGTGECVHVLKGHTNALTTAAVHGHMYALFN